MASKAKKGSVSGSFASDTEHFGECLTAFKRFVVREFKGEGKSDMLCWCERLANAHKRSVFTHLDSCEREIERMRQETQRAIVMPDLVK